MIHHTTNETCTAAIETPTPKVLAHIEAHPGWADEPVVDLMRAGFTAQEYAYFFDMVRIQSPESPEVMRAAAETLLLAADRRELDQAIESGRRVVDVAFPDGEPGAVFHLVHQKMTGSAFSCNINIRVGGPWASEIARATAGSTFGSDACTFTYIGLFDFVREWYDGEAQHIGRFVERAAIDEAAQVSL